MGIAMTLLMITMVITVIIAMAAMTSLLNMHATIKMLCFPPHQGGTDLCFDRETSLIG